MNYRPSRRTGRTVLLLPWGVKGFFKHKIVKAQSTERNTDECEQMKRKDFDTAPHRQREQRQMGRGTAASKANEGLIFRF